MIACKKYMDFSAYCKKTSNFAVLDFIHLLIRGLCLEICVNKHQTTNIVLHIRSDGHLCIGTSKESTISTLFFSKLECILIENTCNINLFDNSSNQVWYTIVLPSVQSAIIFKSKYDSLLNDYDKFSVKNKIKTSYSKLI